jgi:hypothetical protein
MGAWRWVSLALVAVAVVMIFVPVRQSKYTTTVSGSLSSVSSWRCGSPVAPTAVSYETGADENTDEGVRAICAHYRYYRLVEVASVLGLAAVAGGMGLRRRAGARLNVREASLGVLLSIGVLLALWPQSVESSAGDSYECGSPLLSGPARVEYGRDVPRLNTGDPDDRLATCAVGRDARLAGLGLVGLVAVYTAAGFQQRDES